MSPSRVYQWSRGATGTHAILVTVAIASLRHRARLGVRVGRVLSRSGGVLSCRSAGDVIHLLHENSYGTIARAAGGGH